MKTNYKIQGTPNSPVLIFSNSLGADMRMWDELIPQLLPYFRILQYDTRGLGKSEVTPLPYTIEMLGNDVIALLDELNIKEAYFCGLSLGGLVGQWLAIHQPSRIKKVILSNTAARIGDDARWNGRIETVTASGLSGLANEMMDRWFTPSFHQHRIDRVNEIKSMFIQSDPLGYCNCCAAIRDVDFSNELKNISIPVLIITGDVDPVTNVEHAEYLKNNIPNALLKIFPAKHLSATELPDAFAIAIVNFIIGTQILDQGMHVRRTVLGNEHVDRSIQNINEFNSDFQNFITKYAWGEIWSRPGLSKHQRSLITLAMLIPLNRKVEFKMHLRAALNNGLTLAEIKEVILHSSLYCGLPAANEAIHTAEEVFKELNIEYK